MTSITNAEGRRVLKKARADMDRANAKLKAGVKQLRATNALAIGDAKTTQVEYQQSLRRLKIVNDMLAFAGSHGTPYQRQERRTWLETNSERYLAHWWHHWLMDGTTPPPALILVWHAVSRIQDPEAAEAAKLLGGTDSL